MSTEKSVIKENAGGRTPRNSYVIVMDKIMEAVETTDGWRYRVY